MNYCFLQEFFMKCRFCEQDVKPVGHNLVSATGDIVCTKNPTKKHVAVYDGVISCPASPSGRHVVR